MLPAGHQDTVESGIDVVRTLGRLGRWPEQFDRTKKLLSVLPRGSPLRTKLVDVYNHTKSPGFRALPAEAETTGVARAGKGSRKR